MATPAQGGAGDEVKHGEAAMHLEDGDPRTSGHRKSSARDAVARADEGGEDPDQREHKRARMQNPFRFPVPSMSYFDKQVRKLRSNFDNICATTPKELRDLVWNAIERYDIEKFLHLKDAAMERRIRTWLQDVPHDEEEDVDTISSFFTKRQDYPLRAPAGIPEFEPGTKFWNARKHFENDILKVDGAFFLGENSFGNKLYVRDCYEEICQEIADDQRAILTGTPGIGKSTFGLLLCALASMGQGASADARQELLERWLAEQGGTMSDEDIGQLIDMTTPYSEEQMQELCAATLRAIETQATSAGHGDAAPAPRAWAHHHFEAAAKSIAPLHTQLVIQMYRRDNGGATFYIFVDNRCYRVESSSMSDYPGSRIAIKELLRDPGTLFIVDGGFTLENGPGDITCKTIQVTSPNYNHYHGFRTESGPDGAKLRYMPLWDVEEISRCHSTCYPEIDKAVVDERAALVGNIPRYLFNGIQLQLAREYIDRISGETVDRLWKLVSNVKAPQDREYHQMDHKVAHIQCNEYFQNPTLRFASKKVTQKIAEILARYRKQELRTLLDHGPADSDAFAVMRGQLLEHIAHEELHMRGLAFEIRRIGVADSRGELVLAPDEELTVVNIPSQKRLEQLTPGEYGVPDKKNFPSIDAVCRLPDNHEWAVIFGTPWVFFQMTVNYSHGVKWTYLEKMIEDIYRHADTWTKKSSAPAASGQVAQIGAVPAAPIKKVVLMFVVTPVEFEKFGVQSYYNKDGKSVRQIPIPAGFEVTQYVLKMTSEPYIAPTADEPATEQNVAV